MANRLRVFAARVLFPSVFLLASVALAPTAARAADPGFCKQYARAALVQVHGALENPRCGAGLQGARWSTEFPVHYEWCLGASLAATGAEREERTKYLRACSRR